MLAAPCPYLKPGLSPAHEDEEPEDGGVADVPAVLREYAHEVLGAEGKVAPQAVLPDEREGVGGDIGALIEEARRKRRAACDESGRDDEDHERRAHAGLGAFPREGEAEEPDAHPGHEDARDKEEEIHAGIQFPR